MRGRSRKLLPATENQATEGEGAKMGPKSRPVGNRLMLSNVPDSLMEWIRKMAEESFRTPEGFVLFTMTGCMKKNQENGGKAS